MRLPNRPSRHPLKVGYFVSGPDWALIDRSYVPYLFHMSDDRIKVTEAQFAAVLAGWLRKIPRQVWERFVEHRMLHHYKRSSAYGDQHVEDVAKHVASELARHDWEVTHPPGRNH